jgi:prevent-host-death family protein
MTRQMTITEVSARLTALLRDVERGEEIEITRNGLPVAKLSAIKQPQGLEGRFAGIAKSHAREESLFSTGTFE